MPLKKFAKNIEFVPCNASQAKSKIKADNDTVGLFGDEYDLKREADYQAAAEKKAKCMGPPFRQSYYHDNGQDVDEFGILKPKSNKRGPGGYGKPPRSVRHSDEQSTKSASMASSLQNGARMRNTNAKYENSMNGYNTFLNDKSELPRLSILDNYK